MNACIPGESWGNFVLEASDHILPQASAGSHLSWQWLRSELVLITPPQCSKPSADTFPEVVHVAEEIVQQFDSSKHPDAVYWSDDNSRGHRAR